MGEVLLEKSFESFTVNKRTVSEGWLLDPKRTITLEKGAVIPGGNIHGLVCSKYDVRDGLRRIARIDTHF
jgi:hypothetical protein